MLYELQVLPSSLSEVASILSSPFYPKSLCPLKNQTLRERLNLLHG